MEIKEIGRMHEIEDYHWWFSAKRRLIASELASQKKGMLLDIGCGTGANMNAFKKFHTSIGCDGSIQALRFSKFRGNSNLVLCNAKDLPFKAGTFDFVTVLDVFEHIDDDERSMRDVGRIMKTRGRMILTVPAHMFMWSEHDVLIDHKRRYCYSELSEKIKRNNFNISKISYWNFMLFLPVLVYKFFSKKTNTNKENKIVNWILFLILKVENIIVRKVNLPFGISIYCVSVNNSVPVKSSVSIDSK